MAFVTNIGKQLMIGSTPVRLQGANFDNIGALGADIGTDNINHSPYILEDYQKLKALGGNHVRFGLSFSWFQADAINNYVNYYAALDQHVAWAKANNLWMIWNLFTTPADEYEGYGYSATIWRDQAQKDELQAFWEHMANHYKNEETVLAYDILNEPTPPYPEYQDLWWPLFRTIKDAVYAIAPNQYCIVEAGDDGHIWTNFGPKVIYSQHDYRPGAICDANPTSGVGRYYPGTYPRWGGDKELVYFDMDGWLGYGDPLGYMLLPSYLNATMWAKNNNLPSYIGEWGARQNSPNSNDLIRDKGIAYEILGIDHCFYTWRHTNSYWKWGVYSMSQGPLVLLNPEMETAMTRSFQGAVQADAVVPPPPPPPEEPPPEVPGGTAAPTKFGLRLNGVRHVLKKGGLTYILKRRA